MNDHNRICHMPNEIRNKIDHQGVIVRITSMLLLGLSLLALTGICLAGYNVWTSEYQFGQQELQTVIARQFPRTLSYMQLFDVTLSNPRLRMDPKSNRLVSTVDLQIDNKILMPKPVNGTLSVSSALKYDVDTRSVRLDQPVVQKVEVNGVPAQFAAQLNTIGNMAAEQILKNYTIYSFKPEQLEWNGKRFEPGAITVIDNGVKVEIKPL
ncbi:DUF1439 domain-containing protein [Herbaspirillum sp. Sphag1AN]|uniref:DUF1439 domain-containing protein n=1 Tax=Herbaspirillum sp. Sphag1AN TaxID=2587030 RepID=UPI002102D397|nr:DUF1439 domain-containing protein [Herbaspirillum sp. Sphag1AN]